MSRRRAVRGWRSWRAWGARVAAAEKLGTYEGDERAWREMNAADTECGTLSKADQSDAWSWFTEGRLSA